MNYSISRREFLRTTSAAACATALPGAAAAAIPAAPPAAGPYRGTFCMFSKPVPQLNWKELAQAVKRARFLGLLPYVIR